MFNIKNPFKKKDYGYSLDEMSLPKLNETDSNSNFSSNPNPNIDMGNSQGELSSPPQEDSLNYSPSSSLPNFEELPSDFSNTSNLETPSNISDLSNHPALSDSPQNVQLAQENPFRDSSQFSQPSEFNTTNPFQDSNSSTNYTDVNNSSLPSTQNVSNELQKIQLETIEKKVSLLDSKMGIMENKIEKIYQMICLEVKPETKLKVEMVK